MPRTSKIIVHRRRYIAHRTPLACTFLSILAGSHCVEFWYRTRGMIAVVRGCQIVLYVWEMFPLGVGAFSIRVTDSWAHALHFTRKFT